MGYTRVTDYADLGSFRNPSNAQYIAAAVDAVVHAKAKSLRTVGVNVAADIDEADAATKTTFQTDSDVKERKR